jgi:hypothetical protein
MKLVLLLLITIISIKNSYSEDKRKDFKKVCRESWCYYYESLEGWDVFYSKSLMVSDGPGLEDMREQLIKDLVYIKTMMPKSILKSLKTIEIYLNLFDPEERYFGGVYHYSREVLIQRGLDPHKFEGIEIYNFKNFLKWKKSQPGIILHEFGHAYIHQFLTAHEVEQLESIYNSAMESGIYNDVPYFNGTETFNTKSYSTKGFYEYFCESIEAYFWRNDYYPFTKSDLYKFDPKIYDLIKEVFQKE